MRVITMMVIMLNVWYNYDYNSSKDDINKADDGSSKHSNSNDRDSKHCDNGIFDYNDNEGDDDNNNDYKDNRNGNDTKNL